MSPSPLVCTDPAQAAAALAAGRRVVLVAGPGAPVERGALCGGLPGRLAVFVGDPDDPDDLAAAGEMAEEVFARDPPEAHVPAG